MKQKLHIGAIVVALFFAFTQWCRANDASTLSSYHRYIHKYKDLAIEQQHKYKIPASITLAQGLLESGAGMSDLAKRPNNHFGIKCHDWKGKRVYHNDDLRGECFRKYDAVKDSYEDHSKFIALRPRYASLFQLNIRDYRGWAKGLQKCGYATDKKYANKLIKVIEEYELYEYDSAKRKKAPTKDNTSTPTIRYTIYRSNGLLYVHARRGDSLEEIARNTGISVRKLSKFNEIPKDFPLQANDIVYLEKKKKRANKPHFDYVVRIGDSMHSISQQFGIQMKSLYKLNKKDKDYIPEEGDVLKLR